MWEFEDLEAESRSLEEHRAAIFAHEVANSLSVISYSIEFFKSEFKAKKIDDPIVNKVIQSALGEIAGLGSLLREYCAPTLP